MLLRLDSLYSAHTSLNLRVENVNNINIPNTNSTRLVFGRLKMSDNKFKVFQYTTIPYIN